MGWGVIHVLHSVVVKTIDYASTEGRSFVPVSDRWWLTVPSCSAKCDFKKELPIPCISILAFPGFQRRVMPRSRVDILERFDPFFSLYIADE